MPKGYGYGGESTMNQKGAAPKMKGSMTHMGHSPAEMGHSPLTKHCTSALRYKTPMKMENVIDRDAKSSGKNQYNKYGK